MNDYIAPRRIKRGWMNLEVVKIEEENHNTRTFILVDAEEKTRVFDYFPGQYLTFRFDQLASKPLIRSYTLSSSPCQKEFVAFTVKKTLGGIVSQYLIRDIKKGDILRARGAMGGFYYDVLQDEKELVVVAAGSGVTPFASMLREYAPQLGAASVPERLSFLLSFRSREDLILWDTFSYFKKLKGVSLWTTLSQDPLAGDEFLQGRINPQMLAKCLAEKYRGKTYMLCGPEQMMQDMSKFLREVGVEEQRIRMESFVN